MICLGLLIAVGVSVSVADEGLPRLTAIETEVIRIVDGTRPSVVAITVRRKPTVPAFIERKLFRDRSGKDHVSVKTVGTDGDPQTYFLLRQHLQRRTVPGYHSGVVYSKEGHILTVAGDLARAERIRLTTHDDRSLDAELVGHDPRTDIAVLRVKDQALKPIPLGDSDSLRMGSWAIVVGNAFGFKQSAGLGIVSGLNRTVSARHALRGMIQITAPVNPGDSGAALLNSRGELAGLVAATYGRGPSMSSMGHMLRRLYQHQLAGVAEGPPAQPPTTMGAEGVNFAIPMNIVRKVADQIIEKGEVQRGYLGVNIVHVPLETAEAFGLPSRKGAMVHSVLPDSPAKRAGIRPKDVIVSLDGKAVDSPDDLVHEITWRSPEAEVVLRVIREGESIDAKVRLAVQPTHVAAPAKPRPTRTAPPGARNQDEALRRLSEQMENLRKELDELRRRRQ